MTKYWLRTIKYSKDFSLDNQTYQDGALSEKVKELLGLVASMVLRCDDCIKYHLGTCHELGVTTDEIYEVFQWPILWVDLYVFLIPEEPLSIGMNCCRQKMTDFYFSRDSCPVFVLMF